MNLTSGWTLLMGCFARSQWLLKERAQRNYANASPKRITLLATGEEVDFTVDGGRIILTGLPKDPVDKHLGVTVFKMEFDEKPGAVIRYYPQMSYGANNAGENVQ